MAKEKLSPMDVYADMRIPFDVAAYCRGHRFSTEAVALTRSMKAVHAAKAEREAAEGREVEAADRLKAAIAAARTKMENSTHA